MASFKPTLDRLERGIIAKGNVLDWSHIRDIVDIATGSDLSPSRLDILTQQLVNRLHKNASHLLKADE
jgi:hypothetical protein